MWWKRQEKQSLKADTLRFAIRLSELSVQGLGYFIDFVSPGWLTREIGIFCLLGCSRLLW